MLKGSQIQWIFERWSVVPETLKTTDIEHGEKHVLLELRTTEDFFESDM